MIEYIRNSLFDMKDEAYRDFHSRLVPNLSKDIIIGVRTPDLKRFATDICSAHGVEKFIENLPHTYYEENNLHAFLIAKEKYFDKCINLVDKFLPYVDNWATCDGLRPLCFKNHKQELYIKALDWINDERTYIKRFGIQVLMNHFLDDDFKDEHLSIVSSVKSSEYYVNMMIAWYFATALAKQYSNAVKVIRDKKLDKWTHNKTIQKAVESFRISDEIKEYLKTLKV